MTIYIKEILFLNNILDSDLLIPPLGAYHIHNSQTRDGIILGAYFGERILGIAVFEFIPQPRLTYVFVEEDFRGHSIGTQLIRAALTHASGKGAAAVGACVIIQNEYGEVCDHILMKTGFEIVDTATIIRYASDERCSRIWTAFMKEKGTRIHSVLTGRGFKTLPFSEASPETFDRLKASIGMEFVSNLDPFKFISNQNDRLVPDYSFITLKNDAPVAFVIVTTVDDKSVVFQQMSITLKHQGSGVFLLPFAAFMEKFLEGDVYSKMAAVVFDGNEKMQRMLRGLIGLLSESMKTQNVYHCKLEK